MDAPLGRVLVGVSLNGGRDWTGPNASFVFTRSPTLRYLFPPFGFAFTDVTVAGTIF